MRPACTRGGACLLAAAGLIGCDPPMLLALRPDARPAAEIEMVGHTDLLARGMNGQLTRIGPHAYVGSLTDSVGHDHAGVLIVDLSAPERPTVVGEIGPPDEGLPGMEAAELRAVPELEILIVLNAACDAGIRGCTRDRERYPDTRGAAEPDNFKIYDISDPVHPRRTSSYTFETAEIDLRIPHEFFVWRDPSGSGRHLLFVSTPLLGPSMEVLEIRERDRAPAQVALFDPELGDGSPFEFNLHSVSVSKSGDVGYLAYWGAGFLMIDTASVASGGSELRMLTPLGSRFDPSPPGPAAMHSAVALPGRSVVLVTEEVFPSPFGAGCPWGWARFIDVSDPTRPHQIGEYKLPENDPSTCADPNFAGRTFTPHNPTVTEHLALITWYGAGLQIIDTTDPTAPRLLAAFIPDPIPEVSRESPAHLDRVLATSYPIIKDGFIHFVDQRNGLYVLRYRGPYQEEIGAAVVEGNSSW